MAIPAGLMTIVEVVSTAIEAWQTYEEWSQESDTGARVEKLESAVRVLSERIELVRARLTALVAETIVEHEIGSIGVTVSSIRDNLTLFEKSPSYAVAMNLLLDVPTGLYQCDMAMISIVSNGKLLRDVDAAIMVTAAYAVNLYILALLASRYAELYDEQHVSLEAQRNQHREHALAIMELARKGLRESSDRRFTIRQEGVRREDHAPPGRPYWMGVRVRYFYEFEGERYALTEGFPTPSGANPFRAHVEEAMREHQGRAALEYPPLIELERLIAVLNNAA